MLLPTRCLQFYVLEYPSFPVFDRMSPVSVLYQHFEGPGGGGRPTFGAAGGMTWQARGVLLWGD